MHYPWWYVPYLTSPMLIAVVSVLHVLVSHYAVGGGFFLAVETGFAYKTNDREYLAYLKRHARFFILVTVVFGAITGVGIWWTIGLASPLATEVMIRTFVFGWAIEYVSFLVEIASAFIFFYYWGRLPPKTHVAMAWLYGIAAWISLVIITGITGFMLNPGRWIENQTFWVGFFNPQFIPQTIARTGGALLLTALYVYLHSAITVKEQRLQRLIEFRSTRPALLGAVMIAAGGALWYLYLPPSAAHALQAAAALNVFMGLIFAATIIVFAALYLGPYRNPGWLHSPGFAGCLLAFGFIAFSTGEFIREAVRKPYIVYNVVFGNQVFPGEVRRLQEGGYLEGGTWTRAAVAARYPSLVVDGKIDEKLLLALDRKDQLYLGEMLFQYHCNDCHAAEVGYSAVAPMVQGWPPHLIADLIDWLHTRRFMMPPWCGTDEERDLLVAYLTSISPPKPKGMLLNGEPSPGAE
jgi:cytochrome bd-type quinol oxidase subunit 1/mono/diheme cytochrome c family protein